MSERDEVARQEALARAQALQDKVKQIQAKHFGPDDPDKTLFGRIWDDIRGGTDRALTVKRIAKEARKSETIDLPVVEPLGTTIRKGDVRWLVDAYRKSRSEHEKVVLMNAMLAYPGWVPPDVMIDHLDLEIVDDLQTVQVGLLLRFFRDNADEEGNRTLFRRKSDEEVATLKAAQERLEGWVGEGRLSALEANLIPDEPWPPQ